ncbi:hypothetical protein [Streptomyces sp. SPB074]|uniref:hypothetical protein n=1 Tax=Streptomyces sp. (strain SPB074) TaxID=465543 RepID=UPI000563B410|nr:hypothetical protein [Streptomyces sp. SPB074]
MADSQQPQGTEKAKGPKMKPLGDTYATGSPANPEGGEAKLTAGEGATTLGDTYATGSPADPEAKILDRPEGDEKK